MQLSNFFQKKVTPALLESWAQAGLNVLLVGEKGVGKSALIKLAFEKVFPNKWVYFSGSTLDPWVDVIGIPKPMVGEDGQSYISYILPKNMQSDLEAIFVDEYTRTDKKVKNALMELIQFRTINGRAFPNLKCVWAATNPDQSEDGSSYDVETLDPAQADRFEIIVNLPREPDYNYFAKKFGDAGKNAVDWWEKLPVEAKIDISPRRLEYAVTLWEKNLDLTFCLPKNSNVKNLVEMLSSNSNELVWINFKEKKGAPTEEEYLKIYANQYIKDNYLLELMSPKYWHHYKKWSKEHIFQKIKVEKFAYLICSNAFNGDEFSMEVLEAYDKNHQTVYYELVKNKIGEARPDKEIHPLPVRFDKLMAFMDTIIKPPTGIVNGLVTIEDWVKYYAALTFSVNQKTEFIAANIIPTDHNIQGYAAIEYDIKSAAPEFIRQHTSLICICLLSLSSLKEKMLNTAAGKNLVYYVYYYYRNIASDKEKRFMESEVFAKMKGTVGADPTFDLLYSLKNEFYTFAEFTSIIKNL